MKRIVRIFSFGVILVVAVAIGYVIGSVRGAEFAGFYRQANHMHFAYITAKVAREEKCDEVYRYTRDITYTYHQSVAASPLMSADLIIPVFMLDERKWYPVPFFGVDSATKAWVPQAGQFLAETATLSNQVTAANGASPRR